MVGCAVLHPPAHSVGDRPLGFSENMSTLGSPVIDAIRPFGCQGYGRVAAESAVRRTQMPDNNQEQPGESSNEQAQPKGPLRQMEERERQMEKQLHELDEHISRASDEHKRKAGEQARES